jgi:hypothetical protein
MAKVDNASCQKALDAFLKAIGLSENEGGGGVTITGQGPDSVEVMAASQAALGITLAGIWKAQTGAGQDVATDVERAVHQHPGIHFMRSFIRDCDAVFKVLRCAPHGAPDGGRYFAMGR